MKTIPPIALAALCGLLLTPLPGQTAEEDDVFELSPFSVSASSNHGYRAASSLAGSRVDTKIASEPASEIQYHDLGATLVGLDPSKEAPLAQAAEVSIEFAIGFYDDTESVRRDTLMKHLDTVQAAVASRSHLHFEPGALRIAPGDRKRFKARRRAELTSYAHFFLIVELKEGASPFKQVKTARDLVTDLGLDSDVTRVFYGAATLMSESPFHSIANQPDVRPLRSGPAQSSDLGATLSVVTDRLHREHPTSGPPSPVSLIKPVDAISVLFAIDANHDRESQRENALNAALERVQATIASLPGASFEAGAFLLRPGDREGPLSNRSTTFTAQAQFRINLEVTPERSPLDQVRAARQLVRGLDLDPETSQVHFGAATLVVDDPNKFRGEILQAIYADVADMKAQLGEQFEVEPKISNVRVRMRQHSPSEVELWIPYDHNVIARREIERERTELLLEHERTLAQSQCCRAQGCCQPEKE